MSPGMIVAQLTQISIGTTAWPMSSGWAAMQRAIRSAVSSAESASRWSSSSEKAPPQPRAATSLARIRLFSSRATWRSAASPATRPWPSLIDFRSLRSTEISSGRGAVAGGLAQHPLELAGELARIHQRGERVAAGALLGLAQSGAGLGERGAEQRVLVVQAQQRLARFLVGRALGFRDLSSALPWPPT